MINKLNEAMTSLDKPEQVVIIPARKVEVLSCTFENKICSLKLATNKTTKPDDEIYLAIKRMEMCNFIMHRNFYCGLREEKGGGDPTKSYYFITFSVLRDFFDGNYNTGRMSGQYLKFCDDRGITSTKKLMLATVDMVRNMANYTHTLEDKAEKQYLRGLKKSWLKFCYKHFLVDSITEQTSDKNDELIRFVVGGVSFHLRKRKVTNDFDFIKWYDNEVVKSSEIYVNKGNYPVTSMEFMEHLKLFQCIGDFNNIRNAELSVERGFNYEYWADRV